MTMHPYHSPKPKIFGAGYGKHVSHNYRLMKKFFALGWKMLVNMFIPGVFYERAHWEVIDLYYKMQGYRHGTNDVKRCDGCGANLLSSDDKVLEKSHAVTPEATPEPKASKQIIDDQSIGDFRHPEDHPFSNGLENK